MTQTVVTPEPRMRPLRRLDLVKARLMRDVVFMRKKPVDAVKEYHRERRKEEHLLEVKTELLCDVISRRKNPVEAVRAYRQEKRETMKPNREVTSSDIKHRITGAGANEAFNRSRH